MAHSLIFMARFLLGQKFFKNIIYYRIFTSENVCIYSYSVTLMIISQVVVKNNHISAQRFFRLSYFFSWDGKPCGVLKVILLGYLNMQKDR